MGLIFLLVKGATMIPQKRILIMDNIPDDIEALVELLQVAGYQVLSVYTIEEAKRALEEVWVHMMIVDLNMKVGDSYDRSGLEIVNHPDYAAVPKVILTGFFNDPKVLRQLIKPASDGRPLVVGFIGKLDGDIDSAIIRHFNDLKFNWDLEFAWTSNSVPGAVLGLVGLFTSDKERVQLSERVNEFEDLFRKSFFDSSQISIGRLLTFQAGIAWLEIFSQDKSGAEKQFVVALGRKQEIKQLAEHNILIPYENRVRQLETFETLRFGATLYECLGNNLMELRSLQDSFFRWSTHAIEEVVDNLFGSTLGTWHKQRSAFHKIGQLKILYESWTGEQKVILKEDEWHTKAKVLCDRAPVSGSLSRVDYSPERLTLYVSDKVIHYPNPIHFLLTQKTLIDAQLTFGIVHGNLYPSNILVDRQKDTRLIEYSQVHEGPILRDFVALEVALKREMLDIMGVEAWCTVEEMLSRANDLEASLDGGELDPEIQKILRAVAVIRRRAAGAINQSIKSYLAGLFVHCMTELTTCEEEKLPTEGEPFTYLYYLLSAAMLCDHLAPAREFAINFDKKFVIVEGKKISQLTKDQWKLLDSLYKRVGQLCEYKDFLKEAYGDDPSSIEDGSWMASSGKPKVNAAIGRLREKIEPDPDNPKYIVLEREHGYKLDA